MHIIISPAKTLDFETRLPVLGQSDIRFGNESKTLSALLKKKNMKQLSRLMGISDSLARLNYERFQNWHYPFPDHEARQALFAFKGEVYNGLDAHSLSAASIELAQERLFILSGLYGLLRPLDGILPYRLEMGTKLKTRKGDNLYHFWGDKISHLINEDMEQSNSRVLVNLASNEYFKCINKKKLTAKIITPAFKDYKNGDYKMISFFAKRARGLMTRFILQNQLSDPGDLLGFNEEGYYYNTHLSKTDNPVFTREHE